jgi:hypothetical protein
MRLSDGAVSMWFGLLDVCQRGRSRASMWWEGWHHYAIKVDLTPNCLIQLRKSAEREKFSRTCAFGGRAIHCQIMKKGV